MGDIIEGTQQGDGWWSCIRLKLLWLGETEAAWLQSGTSGLYAVAVCLPRPYSTPLDLPQWDPEQIVFTGNRLEVLHWAGGLS